ncbi:SpoIIE family protein phosphatase [Streptosporangium sp. NBC_01756]|uniref:SpoIIE family protein phosphatase n=1 Tax=Streptosporangium sp. NBC_01756 TaxID=2975950 RepID=UPI002DD8CD71|nr:SpoIIE family protein phosphatase [Streptosporangium sp. NBC_01756]WSC86726.1 SpoIIE family protein phosphatase [Streptosporangium sp. NBC_01756]
MSEIARRPVELAPLSPELSPQVGAWAGELRAQFAALSMSISLFCRLHPIDKGTVSRYLNGKRVPADRWFLDRILAMRASAGASVTDEVRAYLVDLQMAALQVAHPHEYRVRKVSDALEIAVTSWKEAERYAQALEHQLTERTRTLQDLRIETEGLRAAWDHDRTRYHEEIASLARELELGRDRVRQAEHRVQNLSDLLDRLETQQRARGEFPVDTDVTSQREAEEMRGRLTDQLGAAMLRTARLQGVTAMLAEALTVEQVVQVIIDVGRTALAADRSAVALLDGDRAVLKLVNIGGVPEVPGAPGEEIPLSHSSVMTMAVNSRRPVFAESPESLCSQLVDAGGDEAAIDEFVALSDERAWVGLPLLAAGRALGALRFSFTRPQKISQEDGGFLESLAGQCALALERVTVSEREQHIAESLQRNQLPSCLPVVEGLTLALRFYPGDHRLRVGGDWFDAFVLPDGKVAAVVGDVMGKGVKAAAGMGRIRNTMRALALTNPPPAAVLSGLEHVFEATENNEEVATLAYMVVEPGTGEGLLGLAGHPPPLLVSPEGGAALCEVDPGTPLGWPGTRRQYRLVVPPGFTVILYSDGLENHQQRHNLRSVAREVPTDVATDPEMLLDYLADRMMSGLDLDDDVILFAIHNPAEPARDSERR